MCFRPHVCGSTGNPGNLLEIYRVSWKLPGSVRPFVVNVPDSSSVSKVFNILCTKSPVENGLTEIAGLDIAGLDNGGPDIDGRIPLPSKV